MHTYKYKYVRSFKHYFIYIISIQHGCKSEASIIFIMKPLSVKNAKNIIVEIFTIQEYGIFSSIDVFVVCLLQKH